MNIIRNSRKLMTKINPIVSNKIMYKKLCKKNLNLKNPQSFNEKINWLKIYEYPYDNKIIDCTDKYKLHLYLKKKKLDKYNTKLLGVWNSTSEINWDELPNQFVLKCNHGSKYNIICKNKLTLNKKEVVKKLNKWIKEDFGLVSGELHYSKIQRKIICEEYLGDNIKDFQIWCTKGKILFNVYINSPHGENTKITYDENWNELPFVTSLPRIGKKIKKPKKFDEMIKIAKKLSKEFVFLRLDFYILKNDEIKISEMSFSPGSGFIQWNPKKYDEKIGRLLEIDNFNTKKKRIGIIGRIADGHDLYDGQTVLTRTFSETLNENIKNSELYFVDTYNYKHNPLKCFCKTIFALFTCKNIFILLSKNGLNFYLPFLYYANNVFHKNIYHRVIGGSLADMVKRKPKWVKYLKFFRYNYVETNNIKIKLNELGIYNVKVSPNFKQLSPIDENELNILIDERTKNKRFCTFSRVIKEKGISDAIESIKYLNEVKKLNVYLDIYGPVDQSYEQEFSKLINENKHVSYKGSVNSNESVNVLKKYYMLLFPTYWISEGFPGTIIDCFASGLPVIASDWNCNNEIVKNNFTGIIFKRDSNNYNLIDSIEKCIKDEELIKKMSVNCLGEYKKYKPDKVIMDIVNDLKF